MRSESSPINTDKYRFRFIGHALHGDGYFRPTVYYDKYDRAYDVSKSYLVRYPRESLEKFARRNELAFYSSPLSSVVSKFVSYISGKSVYRDFNNDIYEQIADDVDGKGNAIAVFWQDFMVEAKARGSMLLLVDMPRQMEGSLAEQLSNRQFPYWTPILPELVKDSQIGDDGLFDYVKFEGQIIKDDGEPQAVTWCFYRDYWEVKDDENKTIDSAEHNLGECPIIAFTESGDYPCFGSFSSIADLSKRLFNLDSELDEILRAQTFSILTMQVSEDSSDEQRYEAARLVGESIGTSNLMMHTGQQPAFISPEAAPANIYLSRIDQIRSQINEIGLVVAVPEQRESGLAMEMRFHAINSELANFCVRMEDLERRAWSLTAKWLGIDAQPDIAWPRDFNLSDIEKELMMLELMQRTSMPEAVIAAQQKKIVTAQFDGYDSERMGDLESSIDEQVREVE